MPAKKPKRRRPVKRQRLGGLTVTIQHEGEGFMVAVHHPDGRRTRQRCATLAHANTTFSLRVAEAARSGAEASEQVGDGERRACLDFLTKTADWKPRPTVAEALAHFMEAKRSLAISGTVGDAIEKRKTDAIRRGLSKRHQKDLENRLDRFAQDFAPRPLTAITTQEIEQWLNGLGVAPQTQENFRRIIGSIFSDAVADGRLARNPAARVKVPKIIHKEPGIITPAQLAALLAALPERSRAAVAIQALAGLRRSEALKIDWRHIKTAERLITLDESVAKTADRRHTPMSAALAAWIIPLAKDSGTVAPTEQQLRKDLGAARTKAGIRHWPDNALRHSCISAWAAVESDFSRVVAWAGHSAAVSHRHYRALISREQGEAWISTFPSGHAPATPAKSEGKGRGATPVLNRTTKPELAKAPDDSQAEPRATSSSSSAPNDRYS